MKLNKISILVAALSMCGPGDRQSSSAAHRQYLEGWPTLATIDVANIDV